MTENDDLFIGAEAIYGASTGRGLVVLTVGERKIQFPPAKAREIAAFLVEAVTAAEGDEALVNYPTPKGGGLQVTDAFLHPDQSHT